MTISVIIGSTRQGRFSGKPARWILQQFRKREGIEPRLLDLRDFPMPFFDQPMPPAMPGRSHERAATRVAQVKPERNQSVVPARHVAGYKYDEHGG